MLGIIKYITFASEIQLDCVLFYLINLLLSVNIKAQSKSNLVRAFGISGSLRQHRLKNCIASPNKTGRRGWYCRQGAVINFATSVNKQILNVKHGLKSFLWKPHDSNGEYSNRPNVGNNICNYSLGDKGQIFYYLFRFRKSLNSLWSLSIGQDDTNNTNILNIC